MIRTTFLFLLMVGFIKTQAQDYLISFEGSGAATIVDSVRVENLTQGTSLTVGSENQLQLLGTISHVDPVREYTGKSLLVYPNPSEEEFILEFTAETDATVRIELSDLSGRIVQKAQFFLSRGRNYFRCIGLNAGVYLVQVQSASYYYTTKVISRSTSLNPTCIIQIGQTNDHANPGMAIRKCAASVIQMQYSSGDLLKFTGRSDVYGTVIMDVPAESKTITFNFVPCNDYDNNNYTVVQIGGQLWMAENLKTTKYSNGDDIPEVTGQSNWMGLSTGAYCYFGNDPDNAPVYGCLYNWYAAIDVRNPCPANWHVPSDAEWIVLTSFLGGEAIAGGKMKETGIVHWFSPNTGATNESGFTVIAGGSRSYGNFDFMGYGGSFWSTTPFDDIFAWNRDIFYYNTMANRHGTDKKSGLSVRCIKN